MGRNDNPAAFAALENSIIEVYTFKSDSKEKYSLLASVKED